MTRWRRLLAAVADSIFAQFGSGPRRSLRRSAERPARAAWAALQLLADGRHRGDDGARALAANGAGEPRGHRQQAALKDQRYRAPSSLFAPNPRARGARRASDVGPRSDPHSGGQQRDPLAPPAGRRRRFLFSGWGRNDRSTAAGRALRGTGYRQTGGIERSALSWPPSSLFAPNPRARGARRASDVGPRSDPHSGGQQRDPLAPPAGRRRRFLFSGWGRNDRSTAAGRALRGTGYRQTGGIERSALSCPRHPCSRRILVREGRAEPATSVRGATHIQVVSSVTRWRRLLAAVADSCFRVGGGTIDLPPPAAR